jgi:hypothetical protein
MSQAQPGDDNNTDRKTYHQPTLHQRTSKSGNAPHDCQTIKTVSLPAFQPNTNLTRAFGSFQLLLTANPATKTKSPKGGTADLVAIRNAVRVMQIVEPFHRDNSGLSGKMSKAWRRRNTGRDRRIDKSYRAGGKGEP